MELDGSLKVSRRSGTSWLLYGRISCQSRTCLALRGRGTREWTAVQDACGGVWGSFLPAARFKRRSWAWALRDTAGGWRHGGGERQANAQTNRLAKPAPGHDEKAGAVFV